MGLSHTAYDARQPGFVWSMGLAGLAPLWFLAVLAWSHSDPIDAPQVTAIAIAYAAIVLAFLGGTRWGASVALARKCLFLRERVFSVLPGCAGLAAMFLPPAVALMLLVCAFMGQALWDLTSAEDGRLPYWSGTLRAALTALTVPALLAILARLMLPVA